MTWNFGTFVLSNALEQNDDAFVILLKLVSRLFVRGCDLSKTSCIFREHDPQLSKKKKNTSLLGKSWPR